MELNSWEKVDGTDGGRVRGARARTSAFFEWNKNSGASRLLHGIFLFMTKSARKLMCSSYALPKKRTVKAQATHSHTRARAYTIRVVENDMLGNSARSFQCQPQLAHSASVHSHTRKFQKSNGNGLSSLFCHRLLFRAFCALSCSEQCISFCRPRPLARLRFRYMPNGIGKSGKLECYFNYP